MKAGPFKAHSEVITGCVIYGTFGIFLDRMQAISPGPILFYRMFFGLCTLLLYLALSGKLAELRPGKNRKYLILLAFLNTITALAYFTVIRLSGVSFAVLLLYTAPVYVSLLAPSLLGEKSGCQGSGFREKWAPLALALAGIILVARPEELMANLERGPAALIGLGCGLLSGLSFSGVILTVRFLKDDYTGLAKTFWLTALSLLILLPFAATTPMPLLFENLPTLFLLGLTATLAVLLHLKGFSELRARTGSILALLEPVFGIFFDHTVLKNPVYVETALGCVFILAAAALVSLERPSRKRNFLEKEE